MYTNMVAQLKQLNALDILEDAMKLIPSVRLDAGLPPLVTPTSQIVGVQAVGSAMNLKNGKPMYANPSNQFIALVKGEYGMTPVPVNPAFREQITGSPDEIAYNTDNYRHQENPTLPEFGHQPLAKDEKEQLLLELFPSVAGGYLSGIREKEYLSRGTDERTNSEQEVKSTVAESETIKGNIVVSPMPGNIMQVKVKEGDMITVGSVLFVLEAMKMENDITADFAGRVNQIFVKPGDIVSQDAVLIDVV
jgi:pyruvate/oxaloacetate carboxyltransferase